PDRGDKIATFNEIRHLSAQHEVHVFCLGDGAVDLGNLSGLRDYAASVTAVPVSASAIRFRALRALISGRPLSVAALNEPKLHTAIRCKFAELHPDLIIVYSCNVAQFAEHLPDVPRIMQYGDLDSLKWRQYAQRSRIPLKWIYALEDRRLLAYERHIAHAFSHCLVHTENERDDFERLIPGVPVTLVGNGVDLEYFRTTGAAKRPASMIFTGVMDYRPNIDAVMWFCDDILPAIRAEIPEANLMICGSRPVAAVRRLAKRGGVTVTGWVADTRPHLDRAELFVAPLRMGRGVQNKLLEALAMGLPCVASTAAWRGTLVPLGEGILATDDPLQFAGYIVRLLQDNKSRSEMAAKSRAAAEKEYRWELHLEHLDRAIAEVTSPSPRKHGS
ncbi:MAG: TIGR03087 family PEP-CTERM/XrtA system glycosyltransferase, partial [Stellaceae bacterium]